MGVVGALLRARALWLVGVCGPGLPPELYADALAGVAAHLAAPDLVAALAAAQAVAALATRLMVEDSVRARARALVPLQIVGCCAASRSACLRRLSRSLPGAAPARRRAPVATACARLVTCPGLVQARPCGAAPAGAHAASGGRAAAQAIQAYRKGGARRGAAGLAARLRGGPDSAEQRAAEDAVHQGAPPGPPPAAVTRAAQACSGSPGRASRQHRQSPRAS